MATVSQCRIASFGLNVPSYTSYYTYHIYYTRRAAPAPYPWGVLVFMSVSLISSLPLPCIRRWWPNQGGYPMRRGAVRRRQHQPPPTHRARLSPREHVPGYNGEGQGVNPIQQRQAREIGRREHAEVDTARPQAGCQHR